MHTHGEQILALSCSSEGPPNEEKFGGSYDEPMPSHETETWPEGTGYPDTSLDFHSTGAHAK